MRHKGNTNPPGRKKIIEALSKLMKEKDFDSITTAEIAVTAGVTEGLIYKYFAAKKDLLYQVLYLHFSIFTREIENKIKTQKSAIARLETLIRASLESYTANRVFAKILLLEVRSSPSYFESDAYRMVRVYAKTLLDIIEDGIDQGELTENVDSKLLRKIILGAIEHACLGEIIFGSELDVNETTAAITHVLMDGVKKI